MQIYQQAPSPQLRNRIALMFLPMIRGMCYRLSGWSRASVFDGVDADDVAQEGYLILAHFVEICPLRHPNPFNYLRYSLKMRLWGFIATRKSQAIRVSCTESEKLALFVSYNCTPSDAHQEVRDAIDSLHPRIRDVAYLRYCMGYSVQDIATKLAMNESTVSTALDRSRADLKQILTGVTVKTHHTCKKCGGALNRSNTSGLHKKCTDYQDRKGYYVRRYREKTRCS